MFAYDKTFNPKVVVGHCDLISWLNDVALHLETQLALYFSCLFQIMNEYEETFDSKVLIGHSDQDFAL